MNNLKKVFVVVGPTASGKSDFAVELARIHNGEIISADSRQLYKGLDIGTGKITTEDMKEIPHHMLSVYNLDEDVSVARFARDALPIIEDIIARNKIPIICGGTGQYIDALIYTTRIPEVIPNKILRIELETKSTEELFKVLEEKVPVRAGTIDPHNRVRIIRALEIIEALGSVPTQDTPTFRYDQTIYLMDISRDLLRTRISRRLEKRLAIGMIEEVRNVMKLGYISQAMKKFGLEYVTIGEYLEGTIDEIEMKEKLITKSMQYAKRQQTWNKKYESIAQKIAVQE